MAFKVGQKVICINDDFSTTYGEVVPVKDGAYTVRNLASPECIRLREIKNEPQNYREGTMECSFRADRFKLKRGK